MFDHEGSDDYDEQDAYEFAVLAHVPSLPEEIQAYIVSFCNITSLGALCRVNKEWQKKAEPHLWCHIDFVEAFDDVERIEATRLFFVHCNAMMDADPERFAPLASRVRTLDLGRLLGPNIVQDADADIFKYYDPHGQEEKRCVFDIIAQFKNLESLSVYIKSWWFWTSVRQSTAEALGSQLTRLRSLKVGGQMPKWSLQGLANSAPTLRDLTLINLIETPGQDDGPEPVTFLSEETCKRFENLETLHLCKLAELDGGTQGNEGSDDDEPEYASGMRWEFPREGEQRVLEEWSLLLRHTSKTLRAVTLENRYLCSNGWENIQSKFITPGDTHPPEYGARSIAENQRVLFPVLFEQEWPKLEELTLVGMGTSEAVDQAVAHLKDRIRIEKRAAMFQLMMGDVTPEDISTPVEFQGDWEEDYEVVGADAEKESVEEDDRDNDNDDDREEEDDQD